MCHNGRPMALFVAGRYANGALDELDISRRGFILEPLRKEDGLAAYRVLELGNAEDRGKHPGVIEKSTDSLCSRSRRPNHLYGVAR